MNPQLSIVIPSYNHRNTIIKCLDSIINQKTSIKYEMIVVDSSSDDTSTIIKSRFPQVKLIKRNKRTFPGEARNIGIQKSKATVIITIDTDCIAEPNWINNIFNDVKKGHSIIGGSVGNANPQNLISWVDYLVEFNHFFPGNPRRFVKNLPTCNLIFEKDIIKKYGYFPNIEKGSDFLMTSKWYANREKVLFDPEIRVKHINKTNFILVLKNSFYLGKGLAERVKTDFSYKTLKKFPFCAPLLWIYRYFSVLSRIIKWNKEKLIKYILLTPFILINLFIWNLGYLHFFIKRIK